MLFKITNTSVTAVVIVHIVMFFYVLITLLIIMWHKNILFQKITIEFCAKNVQKVETKIEGKLYVSNFNYLGNLI
jgi:hypothetical protein